MSRATLLLVELREPDGTLAGELSFTEEELLDATLPPVELPQLQPGPYILQVEAYQHDELLFRDDRQIFLLRNSPAFESVSVYPSTVGADAEAIAVAHVVSVSDSRPYVSWYFEGTPIGSGYVEDGADKVVFAPGGRVGVHTVAAELYPWGPAEGVELSMSSSITAETDVFIRDTPPVGATDERVLLRYRFFGHTAPDTDRMEDAFRPIEKDENITLDVHDEELGYRLGDGGRIRVPYDVIPESSRATRLTVRVADLNRSGELTLRLGQTEDEAVSVVTYESGEVVLEVEDRTINVPSLFFLQDRMRPSRTSDFSLLFVRDDDTVFLVPEIDGFIPITIPIPYIQYQSGEGTVAALDILYSGLEGPIVRGIDVVNLESAADHFDSDYQSFLFDELDGNGEETVRGTEVDLASEWGYAVVPDGRYLLCTTLDGTPQYLVWREGDQVTISRPDRDATVSNISPALYPIVMSETVPSGELRFRTGNTPEITTDGLVTSADFSNQQFLVIPGALVADADPVSVATENHR